MQILLQMGFVLGGEPSIELTWPLTRRSLWNWPKCAALNANWIRRLVRLWPQDDDDNDIAACGCQKNYKKRKKGKKREERWAERWLKDIRKDIALASHDWQPRPWFVFISKWKRRQNFKVDYVCSAYLPLSPFPLFQPPSPILYSYLNVLFAALPSPAPCPGLVAFSNINPWVFARKFMALATLCSNFAAANGVGGINISFTLGISGIVVFMTATWPASSSPSLSALSFLRGHWKCCSYVQRCFKPQVLKLPLGNWICWRANRNIKSESARLSILLFLKRNLCCSPNEATNQTFLCPVEQLIGKDSNWS